MLILYLADTTATVSPTELDPKTSGTARMNSEAWPRMAFNDGGQYGEHPSDSDKLSESDQLKEVELSVVDCTDNTMWDMYDDSPAVHVKHYILYVKYYLSSEAR